jgi:hypothetical protein
MKKLGFLLIEFQNDTIKQTMGYIAKHFYPHRIDELAEKLMYIQPGHPDWAVGFNPLEAKNDPYATAFDLIEIFKKFWGNTSYWGARMEELLRNTLIALCENNLTILELRPFLTHKNFRRSLLEQVSNEEVREYFFRHFDTLSLGMKNMYTGPVLNRASAFTTDPAIALILGQQESTINLRKAMDQGIWIILDLSKGNVKANLRILGVIVLTSVNRSAQSRADIPEEARRIFIIIIEEIENLDFLSHDAEEILAQCRKFGIGLCATHQFLDQLPKTLRSAFFGNAGTQVFFGISHRDACQVSLEIDPKERHLIERKLIDLKPRQAYLKIKGKKPMLLQTPYVDSIEVPDEVIEEIKLASFRKWARPVHEVKKEIAERKRLWMHDETTSVSDFQGDILQSLKNYKPVLPDHEFQEGQNDW